MKHLFALFYTLILCQLAISQEERIKYTPTPFDSLRPMEWHIRYDSIHSLHLPLFIPPAAHPTVGHIRLQPIVPGSSIIRISVKGIQTRIYVINNSILQIGSRISITNGQAWIFAPYPAGYQDARTLSMPLP